MEREQWNVVFRIILHACCYLYDIPEYAACQAYGARFKVSGQAKSVGDHGRGAGWAGRLSVESRPAQWPASADQSPASPLWALSPLTREILTKIGVQCSSWLHGQHHSTMGLPGIDRTAA